MDPALQKAIVTLADAQAHPSFWTIGGQIVAACIGVIGSAVVAWHASARSARLAAQHSIEAQTRRISKTLDSGLQAEVRAVLEVIVDALSHQSEQIQVPVVALGNKASLSALYRGASSSLGTLDSGKLRRYIEFYIGLAAIPQVRENMNTPLFLRKDLNELKSLAESAIG